MGGTNTTTVTETVPADELLAKNCCFVSTCLDFDEMTILDIGSSFRSLLVGIATPPPTTKTSHVNAHYDACKDTLHDDGTCTRTGSTQDNPPSYHYKKQIEKNKLMKQTQNKYNIANCRRRMGITQKRRNIISIQSNNNIRKSSNENINTQPPPVIALSRSSFSTNSDSSSSSSSLEATEVDGHHSIHHKYDILQKRHRTLSIFGRKRNSNAARHMWSRRVRGRGRDDNNSDGIFHTASMDCMDDYDYSYASSSNDFEDHYLNSDNDLDDDVHDEDEQCIGQNDIPNIGQKYALKHEELINSLFEDARNRQELKIQDQMSEQILSDDDAADKATDTGAGAVTNKYKNHNHHNQNSSLTTELSTPQRCPKRLSSNFTSDKSTTSKTSKYSRTSNISGQSNTSELLTPSNHRFQNSLRSHRHNGFPRFKRRNYFGRLKQQRKQSHSSTASTTPPRSSKNFTTSSTTLCHPKITNDTKPSLTSDFSACSNSTSSPATYLSSLQVQSFLDKNVKLQKDSGNGSTIGSSISANGRDAALEKLNDKMDILAEVDRDGKWANALLTRIPAKDMTREQKEIGLYQQEYVETRSMLAIKIRFVSFKYGVMVRWNVKTGLADLVLLRKSCPESFMRIISSKKKRGMVKRMKNMNSRRGQGQTKSDVLASNSVHSGESYDSLGLEPTASSPV